MSNKPSQKTRRVNTGYPPPPGSRFFIAQPGDLVPPHAAQRWYEWEVGDRRGQDRICLTSCQRKAELIRDALEAFHENVEAWRGADGPREKGE